MIVHFSYRFFVIINVILILKVIIILVFIVIKFSSREFVILFMFKFINRFFSTKFIVVIIIIKMLLIRNVIKRSFKVIRTVIILVKTLFSSTLFRN